LGVLHPCRCTDGGEIWHGGGDQGPLLRAKFHPHRCNVSPLRGEKPQNRPLSKLNTGRLALRAMLPVTRMWAYAQRDGRPRNIGWRLLLKMTKSESSVIPFLVPRRKIWLTLTARVPCSNAANVGERKTGTQRECCTWQNSVRGQESPKREDGRPVA